MSSDWGVRLSTAVFGGAVAAGVASSLQLRAAAHELPGAMASEGLSPVGPVVQLAFVVAVLIAVSALIAAAALLPRRRAGAAALAAPSLSAVAARARVALGYGIGVVATALCIGRVAIILRP